MTTTTQVSEDTIIGALCISDAGDESALYTNYSGRGMYGATCFGVTLPSVREFAKFLIELSQEDQDLAIDLADRVRTDNMGYEMIFYFPGFEIA